MHVHTFVCKHTLMYTHNEVSHPIGAFYIVIIVLLSFVINTVRDNGESAWPKQLYNY